MLKETASLDDLVAATRVIGGDRSLSLFGGGNSSLKTTVEDITGARVPVIYVKGSGQDMAGITADGFASLRLDQLRRLLPPVVVPDDRLLNELRCALMDASAPDPSVETLVHVLLPDAAVIHSHADAVLTLTNSLDGVERTRRVLGDQCVVIGYAMPGPDLVAACDSAWRDRRGDEIGIVVAGHGLFTVGDDPQQALERHLSVVLAATAAVAQFGDGARLDDDGSTSRLCMQDGTAEAVAVLRKRVCERASAAMIVHRQKDAKIDAFVADKTLCQASQAGPLTPDHVIWTKPMPLVGRDLDGYAEAYAAYFNANHNRRTATATMLDPAPRVILDSEFGMLTAGRTMAEACAAGEIYRHTMAAISSAVAMGGYQPVPLSHVFDLEYWSFQQKKVSRAEKSGELTGQVALVTGAASGIGRGCAEQLLKAGACVVGWDLSPAVTDAFDDPDYLGIQLDVTDSSAMADALARQVDVFGGLDMLVASAGIFPTSANLGELTLDAWRKVMAVNADAVMDLYGQAKPLLTAAYPYGRVVLIASKNVAAPGPGAAAYSSSKAAVTQLSRVAALEWAGLGIRVNMLHPDAVFDTGLWTPELLAARAEHYGMSVDEYKRRNLLHAEITSSAVGMLVRDLCAESFSCVTGAQIPVDGGNERVI